MTVRALVLALSATFFLSACAPADRTQELGIQGSDTEVQLVSSLVEEFTKSHQDANISVAGGGSAVGIAALINGETDVANSSRQMKPEEIESAKKNGGNPQEFILARDGLAVLVHSSNPVTTLTISQVGKIYRGEITNWKDVGGKDLPIVLYGRQSTSGTYGFFRDSVLKADYSSNMRQMEGTQAIVDAVLTDEQGIGYAGVGYVADSTGTPRTSVKILTISALEGGTAISPLDMPAVMSGKYPIFRRIYQYLPGIPEKTSLAAMFLAFEMSDEGQKIIRDQGFYPLTPEDKALNTTFMNLLR